MGKSNGFGIEEFRSSFQFLMKHVDFISLHERRRETYRPPPRQLGWYVESVIECFYMLDFVCFLN